jgi:hypothetical protein
VASGDEYGESMFMEGSRLRIKYLPEKPEYALIVK